MSGAVVFAFVRLRRGNLLGRLLHSHILSTCRRFRPRSRPGGRLGAARLPCTRSGAGARLAVPRTMTWRSWSASWPCVGAFVTSARTAVIVVVIRPRSSHWWVAGSASFIATTTTTAASILSAIRGRPAAGSWTASGHWATSFGIWFHSDVANLSLLLRFTGGIRILILMVLFYRILIVLHHSQSVSQSVLNLMGSKLGVV